MRKSTFSTFRIRWYYPLVRIIRTVNLIIAQNTRHTRNRNCLLRKLTCSLVFLHKAQLETTGPSEFLVAPY